MEFGKVLISVQHCGRHNNLQGISRDFLGTKHPDVAEDWQLPVKEQNQSTSRVTGMGSRLWHDSVIQNFKLQVLCATRTLSN